MTEYEQEMQDEAGAVYGDPRRCPIHGQVISNGMFDAPCGGCEAEMDAADFAEVEPPPEPKTEAQLAAEREERALILEESNSIPF